MSINIKDITWYLIIIGILAILVIWIIKIHKDHKKLDKQKRKIEKDILKLLSNKKNKI